MALESYSNNDSTYDIRKYDLTIEVTVAQISQWAFCEVQFYTSEALGNLHLLQRKSRGPL